MIWPKGRASATAHCAGSSGCGALDPGQIIFALLTGNEVLGDHSKSGDWGEGHHRFCRTCGTVTHSHGSIEAMGGPFLTVQVSTLDNLPVEELLAAPVHYMDGRHDDWGNAPAEVRHL